MVIDVPGFALLGLTDVMMGAPVTVIAEVAVLLQPDVVPVTV